MRSATRTTRRAPPRHQAGEFPADDSGRTLVADFGIARALATPTDGARVDRDGPAVGTPQYMSPEQASGERTSMHGAMSTRSAPCSTRCSPASRRLPELPHRRSSPSARDGRARGACAADGVPPPLAKAVHRALARTPADRWPTAADFASALELAERPQGRAGAAARVREAASPWPLQSSSVISRGDGRRSSPGATIREAALPRRGPSDSPFSRSRVEGDTANAYFASGITDEIRSKLSQLPRAAAHCLDQLQPVPAHGEAARADRARAGSAVSTDRPRPVGADGQWRRVASG